MQPTWHNPTQTPEGELLLLVKELESALIQKNKNCNVGCAAGQCVCAPSSTDTGSFKPNRGDEEKPKLPKSKKQKHNKPKKGDDDKPDFGKASCPCTEDGGTCECSNACSKCYEGCKTIDKTTEFLESKGVVIKYEVEPSNKKGSVPIFMDHSGGVAVEASGYTTNQVHTDASGAKAPKSTFISEKAQIPSVAQTGYDEKGSSLHMHLNDGGDRGDGNWNIAPIEERLAQLKKSHGFGNPGLVEEIADLVEQVAGRLH